MTSLDDAITNTQTILQGLFSKPKCTAKLLTKPPFRFIHDIVTATLRATGFPDQYLAANELDSKGFEDKESKIAFLEKIIHLVGVCQGSVLAVQASKVVAGLEPFNTNIFLASFGSVAADPDLDWVSAIKHCKSGGSIENFPRTRNATNHGSQDGKVELDEILRAEPDTRDNITISDVRISQRCEAATSSPSLELGLIGKPNGMCNNLIKQADAEEVKKSSEKFENTSAVLVQQTDQVSLQEKIQRCNSDPEQTRRMINGLVTKPKCSDKLLAKPPFRFLHDIIMAVNHSTAFNLNSVCSDDEFDSSRINDKSAKIEFLQKVINHTERKLDTSVDAKPSKIIAGLESEKTCLFLQLLVVAATMDVTINNHLLGAPEISARTKGQVDDEFSRDGQLLVNEADGKTTMESGKNLNNAASNSPSIPREKPRLGADSMLVNNVSKQGVEEISGTIYNAGSDLSQAPSFSNTCDNNDSDTKTQKNDKSMVDARKQSKVKFNQENDSASTTDPVDLARVETDAKMVTMRPATARRRPPRVNQRKPSLETSTALNTREAHVTLMEDGDDKNSFLAGSSEKPAFSGSEVNTRSFGLSPDDESVHSSLSDKKLIDRNNQELKPGLDLYSRAKPVGRKVLASSSASLTVADLQAIQSSMQQLARSAAPIGKFMDHIHTDLNQMTKERDFWRNDFFRISDELEGARKRTDDILDPQRRQVEHLEEQICTKLRQIEVVKVKISRNEDRIRSRFVSIGFAN